MYTCIYIYIHICIYIYIYICIDRGYAPSAGPGQQHVELGARAFWGVGVARSPTSMHGTFLYVQFHTFNELCLGYRVDVSEVTGWRQLG